MAMMVDGSDDGGHDCSSSCSSGCYLVVAAIFIWVVWVEVVVAVDGSGGDGSEND